MRIGNFELLVQLKGKMMPVPIKEYLHDGNFFIEGRKKSSFDIVVKNHSSVKAKAIISVDGLSVIDGNEAGLESQGYVVPAWGSTKIEGWRTSNNTVNEFFFSGKGKSYNARMNEDTRNTGVIGVMFFNEVYVAPTYFYNNAVSRGIGGFGPSSAAGGHIDTWTSTCDTTPLNMVVVGAQSVESNLGTGFGQEVTSHAYEDHSKFNSEPDSILVMYYDDREGLERRGIVIDPYKSFPNAFPTYTSKNKFAKRPL